MDFEDALLSAFDRASPAQRRGLLAKLLARASPDDLGLNHQPQRLAAEQTLSLALPGAAGLVLSLRSCKDFVRELPEELGLYILSYLDGVSLARCGLVSRHWRRMTSDGELWRAICLRDGLRGLERPPHLSDASPSQSSTPGSEHDGRRIIGNMNNSEEARRSLLQRARTGSRALQSSRALKRPSSLPEAVELSPWKKVFVEHYLTERNWRDGRYAVRSIQAASEALRGNQCLQMDDRRVVAASFQRPGAIWDITRGAEPARDLQGHEGVISAAGVHGETLVSGSVDRTLKIWHLSNGGSGGDDTNANANANASAFENENEMDIEQAQPDRMMFPFPNSTSSSASSSSSSSAAFFSHSIQPHSRRNSEPIPVAAAFFGSEVPGTGRKTTSASSLSVAPEINPTCIKTLFGHTGEISCVALHPPHIITGSEDTTVRVWDLSTGDCKVSMQGHEAAVCCVAVDGSKVASGSCDNTIRVWSMDDGIPIERLEGHTGNVYCLQIRGNIIVSGSDDTSVRIWNLGQRGSVRKLEGHHGSVICLQFDSKKIVSGSSDGSIKVWDFETGDCRYTLEAHDSPVWALRFDEGRLMSSSFDRSLLVWDFTPKETPRSNSMKRREDSERLERHQSKEFNL